MHSSSLENSFVTVTPPFNDDTEVINKDKEKKAEKKCTVEAMDRSSDNINVQHNDGPITISSLDSSVTASLG